MKREEAIYTINRIAECEGNDLEEARRKVDHVLETMSGNRADQLDRYIETKKMSMDAIQFPAITYADSCILFDLYINTDDEEIREIIPLLIIASVAKTIVCKCKKKIERRLYSYAAQDEFMTTLIDDCIMQAKLCVGQFDASKNASYTTWLIGNIDGWLLTSEWHYFKGINGFKTNRTVWMRVRHGIALCEEKNLEVTPKNIRDVLIEAERGNESLSRLQLKTIEGALWEIRNESPVSLDQKVGEQENDSLIDLIAENGSYGSTDYQEDDWVYEDVDVSRMPSCNPFEYDETPKEMSLRETFRFYFTLSREVLWFVDYLFDEVIPNEIPYKNMNDLVRKGLRAYGKTHPEMTRTERNKMKCQILANLRVISSKNEAAFRRSEIISVEVIEPKNKEREIDLDTSDLDALWDEILGENAS